MAEVSLPGSTVSYYRASYQHLQFFPLIERGKLTLALNGEVGIGRTYGSDEYAALLQELLRRGHRFGARLRVGFTGTA
jgi:outer membrane protein assembly factor BamA